MSFFSRFDQVVLSRYKGISGGRLLKGSYFNKLSDNNPIINKINNALWCAPVFKWGLAIVPLYSALTNKPSVDRIDINTHAALAFTGVIWAYYSTLVRPTAKELFAVSIALVTANGYQLYRRWNYDKQQNLLKSNNNNNNNITIHQQLIDNTDKLNTNNTSKQ